MLDKYIILNREPKIIISMFTYTSYYSKNSYITFIKNK